MLAAALLLGAGAPEVSVEPDVPATATDLQRERAQNSPQLAVDPTDPRFVVLAHRVDGPQFGCGLQVSGDTGRTWLPAEPVPELPDGAERCYAPEVAFGPDGTLYVVFLGLHGNDNAPMGAFLTTSTDRGRTFTAPRRVLGGEPYMVRLAVDRAHEPDGRLHVAWVEPTAPPVLGGFSPAPNRILAAHSDDGGETFSAPIRANEPGRARVVAPALAVGPDERVHVAYYDLRGDVRSFQGLEGPVWDGPWSLVVATSHDGGRRFGAHAVVDDAVRRHERVMLIFTTPSASLAADDDGRLFAAWTDARHGDADVLLRRSTDAGRAWEAPVRLNDDRQGNGRVQHLPALSVAADGRVDAIFYDRRADPEHVRSHVSYTYSRDGGRTFAANTTLTSEPFDTRTGARYPIPSARGQVELGSRLALAAARDGALAAWTDTRLPHTGLLHQDVFTTRVRHAATASPAGPGLPIAALAGLLAVGAATAWHLRRGRGGGTGG